jgi:hypothetical protein
MQYFTLIKWVVYPCLKTPARFNNSTHGMDRVFQARIKVKNAPIKRRILPE